MVSNEQLNTVRCRAVANTKHAKDWLQDTAELPKILPQSCPWYIMDGTSATPRVPVSFQATLRRFGQVMRSLWKNIFSVKNRLQPSRWSIMVYKATPFKRYLHTQHRLPRAQLTAHFTVQCHSFKVTKSAYVWREQNHAETRSERKQETSGRVMQKNIVCAFVDMTPHFTKQSCNHAKNISCNFSGTDAV